MSKTLSALKNQQPEDGTGFTVGDVLQKYLKINKSLFSDITEDEDFAKMFRKEEMENLIKLNSDEFKQKFGMKNDNRISERIKRMRKSNNATEDRPEGRKRLRVNGKDYTGINKDRFLQRNARSLMLQKEIDLADITNIPSKEAINDLCKPKDDQSEVLEPLPVPMVCDEDNGLFNYNPDKSTMRFNRGLESILNNIARRTKKKEAIRVDCAKRVENDGWTFAAETIQVENGGNKSNYNAADITVRLGADGNAPSLTNKQQTMLCFLTDKQIGTDQGTNVAYEPEVAKSIVSVLQEAQYQLTVENDACNLESYTDEAKEFLKEVCGGDTVMGMMTSGT